MHDLNMSCKLRFKCVVIFIKIVVSLILSRSFKKQEIFEHQLYELKLFEAIAFIAITCKKL